MKTERERLTNAQAHALIDLDEHRINDGWRYVPTGSKPTMRVLRSRGYVEFKHDGGRYTAHRITEAGRKAIHSLSRPTREGKTE